MRALLSRIKLWQWIVLGIAGLAVCAGVYVLLRHVSVGEMVDYIRGLGPVPFFGALAVLPAFGVPVVPFYLLAGAFGRGVALVGCVCGLTVNVALCYLLGRWLLHPVAEKLVARLGYRIPVVHHDDRWQVALLLRITPGPPFFVQSYLLALSGVPFGIYMIVSVGVSSAYAAGFVIFGDSLMQGRSGGIVLGVSMVLVVVLAVRFARKALRRRTETVAAAGSKDVTAPDRDQGTR